MGAKKVRVITAETTGASVPMVSNAPEAAWSRPARLPVADVGHTMLDGAGVPDMYSFEYWADMLPKVPGETPTGEV